MDRYRPKKKKEHELLPERQQQCKEAKRQRGKENI